MNETRAVKRTAVERAGQEHPRHYVKENGTSGYRTSGVGLNKQSLACSSNHSVERVDRGRGERMRLGKKYLLTG